MADIFVSYKREDRHRIAPFVAVLEEAGYSVWWDQETKAGLKPGDDFALVIENELELASVVIVIWSELSCTSLFVRDEANVALEYGKLIPIVIDSASPPLGFRSLHYADFSFWEGDKQDKCWIDLIDAIDKLIARAPSPVASPPAVTVHTRQSLPTMPATAVAANPRENFSGGAAFTTTTLPLLAAAWYLGNKGENIGIMGMSVALAFMTYILMRQADRDLSPQLIELTKRWLMPVKGKTEINITEAFFRLFEAVFGQHHFSWHCFKRSVIASLLGVITIALALDSLQPNGSLLNLWEGDALLKITIFIFFSLPTNILGDYISLWETRVLLRVAADRPALLPILLPIDAILTFLIWAAALSIPLFIGATVVGGAGIELMIGKIALILEGATQGLINFSPKDVMSSPQDIAVSIALGAMLGTSFITTIWLWLVLLITPLARILLWSKRSGLSKVGNFINTDQKPFTALGFLSSFLIMLIGTAIWAVSTFWA